MSGLERELTFALEIAERAGITAMRHFRRDIASVQKQDGTWVTEADRAVESELRSLITRDFPDHNILGEEEGLAAAGGGPEIPGAPTWILDPIDGTNNYMAGIPIWATLIALRVGNDCPVGVCHAPALGETYSAAIGETARLNGDVIAVDPVRELEDATVASSGLESFIDSGLADFYEQLIKKCWRSRGFGDFWGHMLVAQGAVHVMVEPNVSTWDYSALLPIVSAAGGRTTQIDGGSLRNGGSCLTTNGALHDEVVRLAAGSASRR
jgi:histidinol-phosphatase